MRMRMMRARMRVTQMQTSSQSFSTYVIIEELLLYVVTTIDNCLIANWPAFSHTCGVGLCAQRPQSSCCLSSLLDSSLRNPHSTHPSLATSVRWRRASNTRRTTLLLEICTFRQKSKDNNTRIKHNVVWRNSDMLTNQTVITSETSAAESSTLLHSRHLHCCCLSLSLLLYSLTYSFGVDNKLTLTIVWHIIWIDSYDIITWNFLTYKQNDSGCRKAWTIVIVIDSSCQY